jgi:hypothetical protein
MNRTMRQRLRTQRAAQLVVPPEPQQVARALDQLRVELVQRGAGQEDLDRVDAIERAVTDQSQ